MIISWRYCAGLGSFSRGWDAALRCRQLAKDKRHAASRKNVNDVD
jgi:hypothetical protein